MSKTSYKIPESINRSYLDHEINLSTKAWQMQPLAMKTILFYAGSMLGLLFLAVRSPLSAAGGTLLLVAVWWIMATITMGKVSKTKEMAFVSVPAVANYAPRSARRVSTRSHDDPSAFYSVAPFDSVSENGFIEFSDKTVGTAFLVVGSASVLLFEEDKKMILNRVDQFWRKVDTDVEFVWITTREPQRVHRQVAALARASRNLERPDPELMELMEERLDILQDWVGKEFQSIHQYLVIKADNVEALRAAGKVLQHEIENSPLMIRQCTQLNDEDVHALFGTVYRSEAGARPRVKLRAAAAKR